MSSKPRPAAFAGDCDATGRITFDEPKAVTAYCRAKFAGKRVDVEIRERKSQRSHEQNRWLHAAFAGWADHLGYGVDELKREVLALVFGTDEIRSPLTGAVCSILREPHTSALNTAQFAELMDRALILAAETGYLIEEPDEFRARRKARKAAA